jgi:hypothetical protein
MPTEDAVACCIAKDEDLYIDEWLQYNLKLGFSRIYVYDNTDDFRLGMAGLHVRYPAITLLHAPGPRMQMTAYNHCLSTFGPLHTWMAFLDVDEFIVLRSHSSVVHLLQEHCANGALSLNWFLYGSGGHKEYIPEPVTRRFLWREPSANQHVKTIVKTRDATILLSPHYAVLTNGTQHDTNGRAFEGPFNPDGPVDVACIHHYFVKSRCEFERKVKRGKADIDEMRTMDEFDMWDKNEVMDDSAWMFLIR